MVEFCCFLTGSELIGYVDRSEAHSRSSAHHRKGRALMHGMREGEMLVSHSGVLCLTGRRPRSSYPPVAVSARPPVPLTQTALRGNGRGWLAERGRESRGSGSDWGPEGTPRMVGVFRVPGEDHPEVNPARRTHY